MKQDEVARRAAMIVHLLHIRSDGWTVRELAAKLGVSDRCVRIAVDIISCENIPVYSDNGRLLLLEDSSQNDVIR